jgi:hypothetical protein
MDVNESDLYLKNIPAQFCVIAGLLLLGGCFAGLTLGLMGLDPTSLKILTQVYYSFRIQ